MRIALIHAHAWPEVRRGGERYVHDLAWYLSGRGHDVELITGTTEERSFSRTGSIAHRRVTNRPGRLARRLEAEPSETMGYRTLRPLLRRFDVVHAFTASAAVAAKLTGHPTIYTNLGLPEREWMEQQPRAWPWFRAATRLADLTTAVSATAAARAATLSGREAVGLFAGIRLDAFPAALEARVGPPTILFASALDEWSKGLHDLLAAMPAVLGRHPDARLCLAGPGDSRRAFELAGALADEVRPSVDVVDPSVAMPELYRAATVTALPSSNEALGLVLLESLASGTPVVACANGGPTEIVTDEQVGRLAPVHDPAGLADALCAVIDLARDPTTPARCHEHARRWDWVGSIGPEHEAAYERVLNGDGRR